MSFPYKHGHETNFHFMLMWNTRATIKYLILTHFSSSEFSLGSELEREPECESKCESEWGSECELECKSECKSSLRCNTSHSQIAASAWSTSRSEKKPFFNISNILYAKIASSANANFKSSSIAFSIKILFISRLISVRGSIFALDSSVKIFRECVFGHPKQ